MSLCDADAELVQQCDAFFCSVKNNPLWHGVRYHRSDVHNAAHSACPGCLSNKPVADRAFSHCYRQLSNFSAAAASRRHVASDNIWSVPPTTIARRFLGRQLIAGDHPWNRGSPTHSAAVRMGSKDCYAPRLAERRGRASISGESKSDGDCRKPYSRITKATEAQRRCSGDRRRAASIRGWMRGSDISCAADAGFGGGLGFFPGAIRSSAAQSALSEEVWRRDGCPGVGWLDGDKGGSRCGPEDEDLGAVRSPAIPR